MAHSDNTNDLNEEIKLVVFELMAKAWADFDDAAEDKEKGQEGSEDIGDR